MQELVLEYQESATAGLWQKFALQISLASRTETDQL